MEKNIDVNMYQALCLWFLPYEKDVLLETEPDTGARNADFRFNFDYESEENDAWKIYIDLEIDMKRVAYTSVRSCFETVCKDTELFTLEVFLPIVKAALNKTIESFKSQLKGMNLTELADKIDAGKVDITTLAKGAIAQYQIRKKDELATPLFKQHAVNFSFGRNTQIVIKCSFIVMDELLIFNKNFDRAHNIESLSPFTTLTIYNSVKLRCMKIDKEAVSFNWRDAMIFYICLECAIQMLLGDHYEKLLPGIEQKGMVEAIRNEFITTGSKFLNGFYENIPEKRVLVNDINTRQNWNEIIK